MNRRKLTPEENSLASAALAELMKLISQWELNGIPSEGITGLLLASGVTSAIWGGYNIDDVIDIIREIYTEIARNPPAPLSHKPVTSLN